MLCSLLARISLRNVEELCSSLENVETRQEQQEQKMRRPSSFAGLNSTCKSSNFLRHYNTTGGFLL